MTSTHLFRLVYISRSVELLSVDELDSLLVCARDANQSHSITGLLLYKDLSFLQVIEGPKKALETLFSSICNDARHFRIKVLVDYEVISERSFPEWSMGFQRLDDQNALQPDGFSDFLESQWELELAGTDHSKQQLNSVLNYFRRHS